MVPSGERLGYDGEQAASTAAAQTNSLNIFISFLFRKF